MVDVVQDEFVVLELVQDDVDNEGLHNAEWSKEVYLDDLDVLLCDVLSGGAVEDVVIQGVEDVVDVVVDLDDRIVVVELLEDELDEDKWEIFVVELLKDVVEVVDVLEDVGDVYEIGAPGVVDDL